MVNYWLVKSEPGCFSWSDQNKVPSEPWNGVRNYQARNNLASMKVGDLALFYHSVTEKKVVGVVEVVKESYPDQTFTKAEKNPWVCVDVKACGSLKNPISLAQIKDDDALVDMEFLRQGRLSVVPVRPKDFERITKLGEWECPKK